MSSNGVATPATAPAGTEYSAAAVEHLFKSVVAKAFADAIDNVIAYTHTVARNMQERSKFYRAEAVIRKENSEILDARRWLMSGSDNFKLIVSLSGFDADHIADEARKCEARGWKAKNGKPKRG